MGYARWPEPAKDWTGCAPGEPPLADRAKSPNRLWRIIGFGRLFSIKALELRIAELEGMLSDLRERGRLAVALRDQWERRALAAESKLTNSNDAQDGLDKKYEQLRRFLAKEFHPDHTISAGIEKLVRTEIFKMVWAKVEELDRS